MGQFVTNRDDVENHIGEGNWKVAFSQMELTETDALVLLLAVGGAAYTDQPEIVWGYLEAMVDASIQALEASIEQTLATEVQNEVKDFAIPLIKSFLQGRSAAMQTENLGLS